MPETNKMRNDYLIHFFKVFKRKIKLKSFHQHLKYNVFVMPEKQFTIATIYILIFS